MALRVAEEGAGRFDHVHGDEGGIDTVPFMSRALEDVVETIMLFGQYPQPRQVWRNGRFEQVSQRIRLDLAEWLQEHYEDELPTAAVCFLTLHGEDAFEAKQRHEKRVTALLTEELRDSDIVRERAEELAEEDRYERA